MEIKLSNISIKNNFKNININFKSSEITGVYEDNNFLKKIFVDKINYIGNVIIDGKSTNNDEFKVNYIDFTRTFFTKKVSDEFFLIKRELHENANYISKVISSLNMLGLERDYLDRKINSLSKSEKRLLEIALNLIINPDIIIFKNPFLYLDKNNKLNLKKIILKLKRDYNKIVIIIDDNINNLYNICTHLIIFKNNQVLVSDKTRVVFSDLSFLINNKIDLANTLLFNVLASKYDKKLPVTSNVNDLIKEVYRNVKETKK